VDKMRNLCVNRIARESVANDVYIGKCTLTIR